MKLKIDDRYVEVKGCPVSNFDNNITICQKCCFSDKNGDSQRSCPAIVGSGRLCTTYDTRTEMAYFVECQSTPVSPLLNVERVLLMLNTALTRLAKTTQGFIPDETVLAYTSHQNDPNITVGDVRLAIEEITVITNKSYKENVTCQTTL